MIANLLSEYYYPHLQVRFKWLGLSSDKVVAYLEVEKTLPTLIDRWHWLCLVLDEVRGRNGDVSSVAHHHKANGAFVFWL